MLNRLLILGCLVFGACDVSENEELQIPIDDLPIDVLNALEDRWPDAALLEAEQDGDVYEVELRTVKGDLLEVNVTEDGQILDVYVEQEAGDADADASDADGLDIPIDELPIDVVSAIDERWPDAALLEAALDGDVYDVDIRTFDGVRLSVRVLADGTIVSVTQEG
ncbi:MAG: hypothetical protein AAFV53_25860 [Myxococcota bacterium]